MKGRGTDTDQRRCQHTGCDQRPSGPAARADWDAMTHDYAVVRGHVPHDGVGPFIRAAFGEIMGVLAAVALEPGAASFRLGQVSAASWAAWLMPQLNVSSSTLNARNMEMGITAPI